MKEIKIGNKELGLRATPLALLYYNQEFDKDLMEDLVSLQEMADISEDDLSGFDTVKILKIAYAMNRADNYGNSFPGFEQWLSDIDSIDFGDPDWIMQIVNEAMDGFFRSAKEETKPKAKKSKENK